MINRRDFVAASAVWGLWGRGAKAFSDEVASSDVGQILITGFRGTTPSDAEVDKVRRLIEDGYVAGVILLRRNIRSPEQLLRLTSSLQSASADYPAIIAIDQEGGEVTRLGAQNGFTSWMSAAEMAGSGRSNEEILNYYEERANELASVGINLNFGPVVDLNINPFNPIIGSKGRTYGRHVEDVVRFAELFIRAHRSKGVKTCLKHFPGHGSSIADSHTGSADVSQTWRPEEIAPFERLVRAGLADTMMNAHVLHRHLSDAPWIPTSLSQKSVTEIREGLSFTGPIITDDMQMGAITDLMSAENASVPAVAAGNSMLIYSNYSNRYSIQFVADVRQKLLSAIHDGTLHPQIVARHASSIREFRASLITHN
ncbi:MAG: glycoside hydrolase family 3 N-terminal domain-containing protein [Roseovarius pacificus]|nr:glycoside hydrolase family 3 N-terminal domain-containing protein [Roseovarius pacificus]